MQHPFQAQVIDDPIKEVLRVWKTYKNVVAEHKKAFTEHVSRVEQELIRHRAMPEHLDKTNRELFPIIAEKFKNEGVEPVTELNKEKLINEFKENFKAFHDRYPVIMKYMILTGEFKLNAFKKFLRYMEKNPPKDVEDLMVDKNARYVQLNWQECNPKHPQFRQESKRVYQSAYLELKNEYDEYQVVQDLAKEKIKELEQTQLQEKRAELRRLVMKMSGREETPAEPAPALVESVGLPELAGLPESLADMMKTAVLAPM